MAWLVLLSPVWVSALAAGLLRAAARWSPWSERLAAPMALLAGTVALTLPFNLKAIGAPRVLPDYLLFVAVAGVGFALLSARFKGMRLAIALAMLTAWWVAQAPPARPEFWRAGLVATLYALLFVRRSASGVVAAALIGAVALWLVREPNWAVAALIAAVASAGLLGSAVPAAPAGAFLAACMSLACLASGRIMTGRVGPAEAAALAPVVAASAWPWIARRLMRRVPAKRHARVAVRRHRS